MIFNYEPLVSDLDINSIVECINLGIANPSNNNSVENFLSQKFKLPCTLSSSGTAALHISLLTLGIGPGDEVLCSDLTFSSTWNVIEYVGATPIFVDVKKETWCMDPDDLVSKITDKSKAVITVDLFGNSCDYNKIRSICDNFKLKIVQDAAESLGTRYRDKEIFKMGDISCTSFNLNKIITSCGGGAVFSSSSEDIEKCKNLINQNKISNKYDYHGIGFNYRMGSINAALLISQAKRIDSILLRKQQIKNEYFKKLEETSIKFQKPEANCNPNNWVNVALFSSKKEKEQVHKDMIESEIEVKSIFKPGTLVEWLSKKYNQNICEVSADIFERSLILPSSLSISNLEIEKVCNVIKKVV